MYFLCAILWFEGLWSYKLTNTSCHGIDWVFPCRCSGEHPSIASIVIFHILTMGVLNQRGNISTLNGSSQKLVDKFTYQRSSISSTETDINMWLAKAWTAIDWLSVIWKSDLTDKMKCSFFQAAVVSILLYGCTTWTLTKHMEKNFATLIQECCEQYWTSPGGSTHKAGAVQPLTTHHENYPS